MSTAQSEDVGRSIWVIAVTGAVRAAFGVIWGIDAYLTWQPAFADHYVGYLTNAAHGQPAWLHSWFVFWLAVVTPVPGLFVWLTRTIETLIAVGLLFGLARKWTYVLGGLFSLLIWATAEGFGGPYTVGAANLGPALVYVLVFIALMVFDRTQGRTPYSLDCRSSFPTKAPSVDCWSSARNVTGPNTVCSVSPRNALINFSVSVEPALVIACATAIMVV